MFTDHIKGFNRWFYIEPGVVGHRCGYNVFRVTVLPSTYCMCGTMVAEVSDEWR